MVVEIEDDAKFRQYDKKRKGKRGSNEDLLLQPLPDASLVLFVQPPPAGHDAAADHLDPEPFPQR